MTDLETYKAALRAKDDEIDRLSDELRVALERAACAEDSVRWLKRELAKAEGGWPK